METSKQLLWTFVCFFIASIVIIGIANTVLKVDLTYLLNYITPLATSVVLGYVGKSSMENITKIKNSNTTSMDATQNTISR